jgi:hypothetical protein
LSSVIFSDLINLQAFNGHLTFYDIESVLDKDPAEVEEDSKTKRKEAIQLETALTVLCTEEKKAANVRADNPDDINH